MPESKVGDRHPALATDRRARRGDRILLKAKTIESFPVSGRWSGIAR